VIFFHHEPGLCWLRCALQNQKPAMQDSPPTSPAVVPTWAPRLSFRPQDWWQIQNKIWLIRLWILWHYQVDTMEEMDGNSLALLEAMIRMQGLVHQTRTTTENSMKSNTHIPTFSDTNTHSSDFAYTQSLPLHAAILGPIQIRPDHTTMVNTCWKPVSWGYQYAVWISRA
jgi:hypothetical protein